MKKYLVALIALFALVPFQLFAERTVINMNANWMFRMNYQANNRDAHLVQLPHTWNAAEVDYGKLDYTRDMGNYTKKIFAPLEWKEKRTFLRFEGANSVTDLFINGRHVGEHKGGYTAFIFELTKWLNYGAENEILIRVSNAARLDVMPLVGDFVIFGGIYRDLNLIVTNQACISPLDYASPGVYVDQQQVSEQQATLQVRTILSNAAATQQNLVLSMDLTDKGKTIRHQEQQVSVAGNTDRQEASLSFTVSKPHLWNGKDDPFMYQLTMTLSDGKQVLDQVTQPVGLRYFSFDADKGFFLNGKHLKIHGVCRHQERVERGNALLPIHSEEDAATMDEMGVNGLRMSHYPQTPYFYDLMDQYGIFVWTEIPFVGPGGYADKGYVDSEDFKANARNTLTELIRQQYNHPSIFCWGLFNELKANGDNPLELIQELNAIAHQEDPYRPTTAATFQESPFNYVSNLIGWNRYDGWYGSTPKTLTPFLEKAHKEHPAQKYCVSEYGAGASIYHQTDTLVQPVTNSPWHPENWQTYYHIENWKIIRNLDYIWGSFIWCMFDFGSAFRTEGDRLGINDKGLVTRDRKVKKDAFYFYKANWNPEPMVYIAERRIVNRTRPQTQVMVFSNLPKVTLSLNGKAVATQQPDDCHICRFDVTLQPGNNSISVSAPNGKTLLTDQCEWVLSTPLPVR